MAGYNVIQTLQVKIRDLEKLGEILEQATDAGANQAGNLQFTVDDDEAVKEEARAQAIEKAKEQAEKIADDLGVDLVRIINFNEISGIKKSVNRFSLLRFGLFRLRQHFREPLYL